MASKQVLMLQGPIGPFFKRLANQLSQQGVGVTKINFNAGDAFYFSGANAISYKRPMDQWPEYFRELVAKLSVDTIILAGDHRSMHKMIIPVAQSLDIDVWVFEEGYLRPDHITLERDGVNGNSQMSKDPDLYRRHAATMGPEIKAVQVGSTFAAFAAIAIQYQAAMTTGAKNFPYYHHHRDARILPQTFAWTRSLWRKMRYKKKEEGVLELVQGPWKDNYYLVPLQLYCDFQIDHSDYESIPQFIEDVVESFASHAPSDTRLILKHHPLDRAYRDYTDLLDGLARRYGIESRIHYIHDQHLPTMLKCARGVITMNSTVGTSALFHGTPVKVLGRAIYNLPELTYQGCLAEFFGETGSVDTVLFNAFNQWMRAHNQYNGSFYKKVSGVCPEYEISRKLVLGAEAS